MASFPLFFLIGCGFAILVRLRERKNKFDGWKGLVEDMTAEGRTVRFREIGNDEVELRNMNKGSEMCHNRVPVSRKNSSLVGKRRFSTISIKSILF